MSHARDAFQSWLTRTAGAVQPGALVSFQPGSKDREYLPGFRDGPEVITRPIECADQVGAMRVLPGDRVRVRHFIEDHALVSHAAAPGILLLTSATLLEPIINPPTDMEGTAAW